MRAKPERSEGGGEGLSRSSPFPAPRGAEQLSIPRATARNSCEGWWVGKFLRNNSQGELYQ